MSAETRDEPALEVVRWLAQHAGFPARRLAARAELLVCIAALAAAEERAGQQPGRPRQNPSQAAALKTHALRRSQVHFKCDNSAKV